MSQDIEAARAAVSDQIKFDILTATHELDNEQRMKDISRSFVSDTITVPTKEMFAYATRASLGDDVYHDPSTHALEEHIARIMGKEAALFVPSGTMSNQLALRTHLRQPPFSVLCDARSHIYKYEAGGAAFHSGAATVALLPSNGHHLTVADIDANIISGSDVHCAPTEVIALENTLNGTIIPQADVIAIGEYARKHDIKLHLDGARIWHVAAETGTPLSELVAPFDSISVCFSKGLGAPVGSCLVGTKTFVTKARWFRKLFGGGMRQTGMLAATAAFALTHHFPLLPNVHALARKLERSLLDIGVAILSPAETCMLFFDPSPVGVSYTEIAERAATLPEKITQGGSRIVIHIQTDPRAVDDFVALIATLTEEKRAAGFAKPNGHVVAPTNTNMYRDVHVRSGADRTDL